MLSFCPELIVIDLDGTLIHSAPDIASAANKMMQALGLKPHPQEKVEQWVGNGVEMLIKRTLTGSTDPSEEPEQLTIALKLFSEFYEANVFDQSRCYEGVTAGLALLRQLGYRLACVTNKPSRFTRPLMIKTGLQDYFEFVGSGDDFPRLKPDPLPLLVTAEHFQVEPAQSLIIGDSINDIQAGKAAGFKTASVPYGYCGRYNADTLGADIQIESILGLAKCLPARAAQFIKAESSSPRL